MSVVAVVQPRPPSLGGGGGFVCIFSISHRIETNPNYLITEERRGATLTATVIGGEPQWLATSEPLGPGAFRISLTVPSQRASPSRIGPPLTCASEAALLLGMKGIPC